MRTLLIASCVVLSVSTACYPIVVKPECQARVDECLKGCPSSPADQEYSGISRIDTRSDCQRHCHEICAQTLY